MVRNEMSSYALVCDRSIMSILSMSCDSNTTLPAFIKEFEVFAKGKVPTDIIAGQEKRSRPDEFCEL